MALTRLNVNSIGTGAVDADELAATGVSAGTYGSSSAIPQFTVDEDGRLTYASNINISDLTITSLTTTGNLTVDGNLTVSGTTTTINTETINLADNLITLNSNATGTATENAGIEIERGSDTNVQFRWNETNDRWELTADGTNYYEILTTNSSITTGQLPTITSLGTVTSGVWQATNVAISYGGTGASTAGAARQNLGVEIGVDVQAYDADLDSWAGKTAPSGTVVGTTDTQTLTNKTLGATTIGGHLIPDSNETYDLGSSSYRFRDLYLSGSTVNLGGARISTDPVNGIIGLVPKPTVENPHPYAFVINRTGRSKIAQTNSGVINFSAVADSFTNDDAGFSGSYNDLTDLPTIPSLTITQVDTNGTATETYSSITTLQFDEDSGFDVTSPGAGTAKVAMNSTFKYWEIDGVQTLTATGLDTINFVTGTGISLTGNNSSNPKTFTIGTDLSIGELTDVDTSTPPTTGQVLKWDGSNWSPSSDLTDTTGSGIALTDLSVGSEGVASGDGGISYNNSTGVFTYTPPDLSSYSTFSGSYADLTDKPTIPSLTGYATETYVDTAVANLVDTAPTTLDTLNELAAALGDDANFATTITNQLVLKANTADLATVATTGSYTDLTNKPTIPTDVSDLTDIDSLLSAGGVTSYNDLTDKPTLFSGSYTDLTNKPTLFDGAYSSLTGTPTLFSGSYTDLTDKPTIPALPADASGYLVNDGLGNLSWAAGDGTFSGDYNDLTNKPTLFSGSYTDLTNKPDLSVYQLSANAFSGSYTDLTNKPTIPTVNDSSVTIAAGTGLSGGGLFTTNQSGPSTITISSTITQYTDADARAAISVTDAGGDGSLAYNSSTGVITYTGPSATEVRAHFTAGTGITVTDGEIATTITQYTDTDTDARIAAASINDLNDITITTPTNGQVLKYNGSVWVNGTDATGGGGGSSVTVSETAPTSPSEGDLWYDSTSLQTYIYYLDGNNNYTWVSIDSTPLAADGTSVVAGLASYTTSTFTATAGQTTFAVNYTVGYIDLYLNGIKLINTDDYTATNGTSVVLTTGAAVNDVVEVVVWRNTPVWQEKTTNYTAVAGDKLFVDSSANAVTVTLPASPAMGDEIRIIDATGSAATYNITVARNGNNILGVAEDLVIQTDRAAFGLVYYNSAQGWVLMEK